ncbi:hypothetical protein C8F01DRAFT_1136942 [Mycena amicta]|nr:hypothetical protein C8F01DRAFT_1136942 [Mycena amicta]
MSLCPRKILSCVMALLLLLMSTQFVALLVIRSRPLSILVLAEFSVLQANSIGAYLSACGLHVRLICGPDHDLQATRLIQVRSIAQPRHYPCISLRSARVILQKDANRARSTPAYDIHSSALLQAHLHERHLSTSSGASCAEHIAAILQCIVSQSIPVTFHPPLSVDVAIAITRTTRVNDKQKAQWL